MTLSVIFLELCYYMECLGVVCAGSASHLPDFWMFSLMGEKLYVKKKKAALELFLFHSFRLNVGVRWFSCDSFHSLALTCAASFVIILLFLYMFSQHGSLGEKQPDEF